MCGAADIPRTEIGFYYSGREDFVTLLWTLLIRLTMDGADQTVVDETRRCLGLGECRADWLLDEDEIDARMADATGVGEKNYWVCMRAIHGIYEDESGKLP